MRARPWREHFEKVKPYKPGKSAEEVRRSLGLEEIIKLASNESAYPPPDEVIESIVRAVSGIKTYPDPICRRLREKLSAKLGVSEEKFVFGNGSDEIIVLVARCFLDSGSEVILPEPSFLYYGIVSDCQNAKVVRVPPRNGFKTDVKAVLDNVTDRTRMIYLSNPSNPTGSMLNAEEIMQLIEGLGENVVLFLDEAYHEYVPEQIRPDLLGQIDRQDRLVIVSRTFSKAYGLAGLRIGYGMMREDVADIVHRARPPFNVNTLAQEAACAVLDCEEIFSRRISETREQKKVIYSALKDMGLEYVESHTNFVLIDTRRDSAEVSQKLLEKGIIVRDMGLWGLEKYLRVSVSTPEHNRRFIDALGETLAKVPENDNI